MEETTNIVTKLINKNKPDKNNTLLITFFNYILTLSYILF
jgi:hypothetical protein